MKAHIKIFFAFFVITASCFNLFSQVDSISNFNMESEEIKTGHVFIDGKYIEPPYIVKREGMQIFINNNLVFDYQRPVSPFDFKQKPIANFNQLDQNSPLGDIFKVRDTTYNKPLVNVICSYYLEKHEYSVACDSIAEFYRSLPNIKSFKAYDVQIGTFQMTSKNEESRIYTLIPFGRDHNLNFGPNSESIYVNKAVSRTNDTFEEYCSDLKKGIMLIFISSNERETKFIRTRISTTEIKDFCNILLSGANQQNKIDTLTNIVVNRASAKKIIESFTDKSVIIKILEQVSSLNNTDVNKALELHSTPHSATIMAWCPNPWENNFTGFLDDEIVFVRDAIKDQGYVYNVNNVFTDPTYDDHDFGTCTYENFKSLANAGFLYIASHGFDGIAPDNTGNIPPSGILAIYSDSQDAINQWREGDPNIIAFQHFNNSWNTSECWSAIATAEWAEDYLASGLQTQNAISILSTCHSHTNGWVDACAGGICFGYRNTTEYWGRIKKNNRELLERMNGTIKCPTTHKPIYREAHDAYANMPFHYDEFTYSSNNFVRLCPAIESLSPYNQEYIQSDRTSGLITIDTWCIVDNAHRAEDAITFTTSEGIVITDVYWVMEEGNTNKSRKIEYHWAYNDVESGEIMVTVNPEFIVAHGGGNQQLDFDGTTPNGDQGNFKFYIEANFSCGISVLPSTLVNLANQGENELIFEANCNDEVMHYQWFFEGGTPSTSNLANPVVTYNNEGLFDVNLTITGTNNQSCVIVNQDYIYVHDGNDTENDIVSCDYFLNGDAEIKYIVYVDYVPEGYSYDITVYYGDGTTSSTQTVEDPTILESIRHYSYYGTYYPFVEVKLTGQDEALFITDCGNVDVVNLNPCSNFTADFNFYPEYPYPNEEIFFEPIINNCGENCYWSWDFASEPSSPVYNDDPIWCSLNTNVDVTHTYNIEGNYYVKLTVYESENGCLPYVVEKEVPVGQHVTCFDPINIYCSHYKPGNPINRVLVRKYFCALELYWHHTINTYDQCQPIYDPNSAVMFLYRFGAPLSDINTNLIRTSPYSSVDPPWHFPHDYCYYTALTWDYLPYGRYVFHVDVYGYAGYHYQKAVGEIDVDIVDCDLTATFNGNSAENDAKFAGAVNNPPYYSSGNFVLNSSVNGFVNSNSGIYTACNEIILCDGFKTGDKSFIATGDGFADCITYPINWWGYYYSALPDIIEESQNSIILTFEASPNPYRDFIDVYIELSKSSEAILSLFGYNGTFIEMLAKADLTAGLNEFEFDLGTLSPGTYMLKALINDSEEKTLKITKQ
ncbi:MAG: hypothetical protein PHH30_04190 [Bacteroidales bacterium]|nr:hypothetical protein [Bacteroidales bacterium]MDD3859704.1 hypothetical protein [Bacteroidales bacterium]